MKSILSVLVLSVIFLQAALALPEFEAYRLVAYEQNGKLQGSKIGSFNLVGTHFSADLLRKLAVIHFSEVSDENINTILGKKPSGLLVILPKERFEGKESQFWTAISENLVSKASQIPVYFCEDNDTIMQFYEKSKSAVTGEKPSRQIHHGFDKAMTFIVNTAEPKLLKTVTLEDFAGVLDENAPTSRISTGSSPVILVVASYDSFTHVPDAKLGLNEFSSGAIALLNIAKQLSEFFEGSKEVSYNVLFYLTSSKSFGYEGFQTWVNKAENSRVVGRIEYAIFLDSLASSNDLNLQIYNPEKDTGSLHEGLKKLSEMAVHYKVNTQVIRNDAVLFNNKFPIVRVSDSQSGAGWINAVNYNAVSFKKNIALFTEFLISAVYGMQKNFYVVDGEGLNQEYFDASLKLFDAKSTFPTQIVKDSAFTQELYRAFSEVVKHPLRNAYTYSSPQLYTTAKAKVKLTRISSAFFDLYLLIGNLAWLSVLYFVLSSLTKKTDDGSSRKLKREDSVKRKIE